MNSYYPLTAYQYTLLVLFFFFFQAEDGIRDLTVTGVQTCALPICKRVKDIWYQLRILQPLNRVVLEEMAHDAEVLGELLGREHDLDFLLARLEKEIGRASCRERV